MKRTLTLFAAALAIAGCSGSSSTTPDAGTTTSSSGGGGNGSGSGSGSSGSTSSTGSGSTGSAGTSGSSTGSGSTGSTGTSGNSTGGGSNHLSGPLAFPVASTFETTGQKDGGGQDMSQVGFVMTDQAVTCAQASQNDGGPNFHIKAVGGVVVNFNSNPVVPGTFPILNFATFLADGGTVDSNGNTGLLFSTEHFPDGGDAPQHQALSGTITYSSVSPSSLSGSFNVTMGYSDGGDQSSLSGSFSGSYCAGLGG